MYCLQVIFDLKYNILFPGDLGEKSMEHLEPGEKIIFKPSEPHKGDNL